MAAPRQGYPCAAKYTRPLGHCNCGGGAFARDAGLVDQIRRASVSVMSNIAEGFERGGSAEFVRFLFIARLQRSEYRSEKLTRPQRMAVETRQQQHEALRAAQLASMRITQRDKPPDTP